jgi:hypothetical protein
LDYADERILRVFLNVLDVTNESGPFTFIPAPESKTVVQSVRKEKSGKLGRLSDEEVYGRVGEHSAVRLTGNQGSVALVDPARCLHFGSRRNRSDRVIFMLFFLPVPAHKEPTGWIPNIPRDRYQGDPVKRMVHPIRFIDGKKKYVPAWGAED